MLAQPCCTRGTCVYTLSQIHLPCGPAAHTHPPNHTELALGAEFQKCSKRAQNRNQSRKKTSLLNLRLNDYRQVYFDKEDRKRIPEAIIQDIRCAALRSACQRHAAWL